MTIYFDMDGTIADLYSTADWLNRLRAYDPRPYIEARPLVNMSSLARLLNALQDNGYSIGIISWSSKESNKTFDKAIAKMKLAWLRRHLPSVNFNVEHIVPYGTRKSIFMNDGDILFDDEKRNREDWINHGGIAFDVDNILNVLKGLK